MMRTAANCTGDASEPDCSKDGRLMYYESQVQPRPNHRGALERLTPDEVRAIFSEALDWSTLSCPATWPLPPAGLPGKLNSGYDRYEPAAALIRLGMEYMQAAIRSEGRAMHNRWQRARDYIDKLERDIEERIRQELAQEWVKQEMRRVANAPPQVVYFIGSADGPIKIGISNNPRSRLSSLQTSHPQRLTLLATCSGGAGKEREYHNRFAAHRLSGEWFKRTPELLAEIERLAPNPTLQP